MGGVKVRYLRYLRYPTMCVVIGRRGEREETGRIGKEKGENNGGYPIIWGTFVWL